MSAAGLPSGKDRAMRSQSSGLSWAKGEGRRAGEKPEVLEMARAVEERRTTATTRRVPPQRGQVEGVGLEGPPEDLGPGDGAAGRPGTERLRVTGHETASASGAGEEGAGTPRGRTLARGAKTPKSRTRLALRGRGSLRPTRAAQYALNMRRLAHAGRCARQAAGALDATRTTTRG